MSETFPIFKFPDNDETFAMPNLDSNGLYTYYDYTDSPLQWFKLDARHDPEKARCADNISAHHKIHYGVAGGKTGLAAISDGSKKPWLYVHGGPGGGFSPTDHHMVDPADYVPIMMLQRGGAGTGYEGIVEDVSVKHFIVDFVDVLAEHDIEKAYWAGGSWGTTLVLSLLLAHPELFIKLPTLRGLWIPSTRDLEFGYSRLNTHFPNYQTEQAAFFGFIETQKPFFDELGVWQEVKLTEPSSLPFLAFNLMINGHHDNNALRIEAAQRMWKWELISAKANPTAEDLQQIEQAVADVKQAMGFAAIICHFAANNFFLGIGDDYTDCVLWQRKEEIAELRLGQGHLVHGANDSLCRPEIAKRFCEATGYKLHLIEGAGHSRSEPGIRDALIRVDNRLD